MVLKKLAALSIIVLSILYGFVSGQLNFGWITNTSTLEPNVTVILMVKNEENVLAATLEPIVQAGFTHFLVYDTGSTDHTVAVTRQFFADHPEIIGVLEEEPFVDFATSRNKSHNLARKHFPKDMFLLSLGAEYYLQNGKALKEFCQQQGTYFSDIATAPTSYSINVEVGGNISEQTLLVRSDGPDKWIYPTAEFVHAARLAMVPETIFFEYLPSEKGRKKSHARWYKDKEMLLELVAKDSTDARSLFYLAQTCECLHQFDEAILYYQRYIDTIFVQEHTYLCQYRIGLIYDAQGNWDAAYERYIKAYTLRPWRCEPLVRIAEYFFHMQQYALAYIFGKQACLIPYPEHDFLSIEKDAYHFVRYEKLSCIAFHLGLFTEGKEAAQKAASARPDLAYLQENVRCFDV